MSTIMKMKIRRPDDLHVHLREGDLLKKVLPFTAATYGRALVMPNLKNPIVDVESVNRYFDEIRLLSESYPFRPLMTIKLTQATTPKDIAAVSTCPAVNAVKLYPEGVTTNSHGGVSDLSKLVDTLKAIQDAGLVLCIHGEAPGKFSMVREKEYLTELQWIIDTCPRLRIVLEHITTQAAVEFVKEHNPNLAATITAHHLYLTLDDVVGGSLQVHNFCKPIAKTPSDRLALISAATSGSSRFFFGSDSAPHTQETKECASGCAGCFTAPHAIELLAHIFDDQHSLDRLEAFTSQHGAQFYGLPLNEGQISLERMEWSIPAMHGPVVPFRAGELLHWRAGV